MSSGGGRRTWSLILGGLVLATLVSAWASSGGVRHPGRLDPQNPGPDGAQALARVLDDHGVEVRVVRGAAAYDRADVAEATVMVTSAGSLGRSTVRRLLAHPGAGLLLVEPPPGVAELVGGGAPLSFLPDAALPAQCADTRLTGLRLEVDAADSYPADGSACFPAEGGAGAVWVPQSGSMTFFGGGAALTNEQITRADNAAVAVRLLGGTDRLVWYVPDLGDLAAGDEVGLSGLLPRWLEPALWLGALTLLALALWRGRRLGPLATEPLPVVVKAIETTRSRGRLYRRAGDRAHAAAALRAAARVRASERLRLPRNPALRDLVTDAARHTGRTHEELMGLLSDRSDTLSEKDLTALAGRLAELDEQLRKAPR